jgi:hypothetical protein
LKCKEKSFGAMYLVVMPDVFRKAKELKKRNMPNNYWLMKYKVPHLGDLGGKNKEDSGGTFIVFNGFPPLFLPP